MQETPEELAALQRLLDESIGSSGQHLVDIVQESWRLSAQQLVTALTGMKVLVVATVTAAGEPRTSCVDGHFLHGTWMFSTAASAYKARHLRVRPALSVTHVDGERMAVFAHGYAEYLTPGTTDSSRSKRISSPTTVRHPGSGAPTRYSSGFVLRGWSALP